jgi:hypothetical protein
MIKPRNIYPLSLGADAKTVKGQTLGYATGILYLAPVKEAGFGNVCPNASVGCAASCLFTAGRARMSSVRKARIAKTRRFFLEKDAFISDITNAIVKMFSYVKEREYNFAVRLNGTSDLPFEKFGIFEKFEDITFYDYTKSKKRMLSYLTGDMQKNYSLTFSRSETNHEDCMEILKAGGNVAVVFATKKNKELPTEWKGFKVVDGDKSDLRFLDDKNVIVGLRAKGDATKDESGFVVAV